MLTKITKGKNFDGVLGYIFSKPKAKLVCQNLQGTKISERVCEFNEIWSQRKRVQRPVFHVSLSLPKEEKLSKRKWKRIITYYLDRMGFSDCRYVAVRHRDTEHDHVHIVASRVTNGGLLVSDSWDYLKSQAIARQIEKRYHLTPIPSSSECFVAQEPHPDIVQRIVGKSSDKVFFKPIIQKTVIEQARLSQTLPELVERLKQHDITVTINKNQKTNPSDKGAGIFYRHSDYERNFSGSSLGRGFTEYGLQRYLLGGRNYVTSTVNPSPWLTLHQAEKLYRKYASYGENLGQIAQKAGQDQWNWDAIRFILSQSNSFKEMKRVHGRRVALKFLNEVISSVTVDFDSNLTKPNISQHFVTRDNCNWKSSNETDISGSVISMESA